MSGVLMRLPEIPLPPNGKIDRRKLPKVEYVPDDSGYSVDCIFGGEGGFFEDDSDASDW